MSPPQSSMDIYVYVRFARKSPETGLLQQLIKNPGENLERKQAKQLLGWGGAEGWARGVEVSELI